MHNTRVRTCILGVLALSCAAMAPGAESHGRLEIAARQVLIANNGEYGIPDEQLHFPYLYESRNGFWYLTYREGPHLDRLWGPGNRVQCVQSRDRGKTWVPWMGLNNNPQQYQLFVTRMKDGSLLSWRLGFEDVRQVTEGKIEGTAILLRSRDEGATWKAEKARVGGLPYSVKHLLLSLWGKGIEMPDGRLLWALIHRQWEGVQPDDRLQTSTAGIVESTDEGKSFRYLASVCEDPAVKVKREPAIVKLASGDLLCIVRMALKPDTPMLQTRSRDGGRSWSAPRRLSLPGACPQLLLLENGVLVMSFGTRRIVQVMASWDGTGESWSQPVVLYKGQTSGYSNVQSLGPDRFRVVYQEGTFDEYQPGGHRLMRVEMTAVRER